MAQVYISFKFPIWYKTCSICTKKVKRKPDDIFLVYLFFLIDRTVHIELLQNLNSKVIKFEEFPIFGLESS